MSIAQAIEKLQKKSLNFEWFPFRNALQPYLVLLLVSVGLYVNTFNHEIAFDDESAMLRNEYVIKGIAGIPGILSHDSYYSYYKQMGLSNALPGGRYRPLSQVTFAVEQEFIGTIPNGIINSTSWDINGNNTQDIYEDTNQDGLYNKYDFMIRGAKLRHFINVLLYTLLILLMFYFLINYIFPKRADSVFFAVLLFAVHPLHTEVVSNIKSRDEILSLIFIFLTMIYTFRYLFAGGRKNLIYIFFFMLFALLSKEYALVLFAIIPLTLYLFDSEKISFRDFNFWILILFTIFASISFILFFNSGILIAVPALFLYGGFYFAKASKFSSTRLVYALGAALIAYLGMRFSATIHTIEFEKIQNDILGNPYMYASPNQVFPSKIATWVHYIKLFFVPCPLLADYSYSTLPYSNYLSLQFIFSLIIFGVMITCFFYFLFKRDIWLFPIMLLLAFFLPITNLFIDIGAVMGERLFFHASVGLCLLVSMLIFSLLDRFLPQKLNIQKKFFLVVMFLPISIFSFITINRNPDWKNNTTLFLSDVKKAPRNINIITAAGTAYYDMSIRPANFAKRLAFGKLANHCFDAAISLHHDYYAAHLNKSINLLTMGELDSSLKSIENVIRLLPESPNAKNVQKSIGEQYSLRGVDKFKLGNKKEGLEDLMMALKIDKRSDRSWTNMGRALMEQGAVEKAIACYQSALQINPKNNIAISSLRFIDSVQKVARVNKIPSTSVKNP